MSRGVTAAPAEGSLAATLLPEPVTLAPARCALDRPGVTASRSPPPPASMLIVPPTWYPVTSLTLTVVAPAAASAAKVPVPLSWLCHQEYGDVRPTPGLVTLRRTYAGPFPSSTPTVLA